MLGDSVVEAPTTPGQSAPVRDLTYATTSAWVLSKRHGHSFGVADGPRRGHGTSDRGGPPHHGRFLREIVGVGVDLPGHAWLASRPPIARSPRDGGSARDGGPVTWLSANSGVQDQIDRIERDVEAVAARVVVEPDSPNDDHTATVAALHHRIFLDAARFGAVVGDVRARVDFWVVLDLHFHIVRKQLRCHVTTWVFSAPPPHPGFNPDRGGSPPTRLDHPVADYHRAFTAVAEAVSQRLRGAHFSPVEFRGHWRRYGFPQFWVAIPCDAAEDPRDYVDHRDDLTPLMESMLDVRDARDHAVAKSVLNGGLLVLRRVRRRLEGRKPERTWRDVSQYLVIPDRQIVHRGPLYTWFAIESLVPPLSELEIEFSDDLYQLEADLEIWDNHIKLFNLVSERGSTLWDALSTHLPIRRRGRLAHVHRAIELLHQLLMQALADLAHIEALVGARVARVDDAKEDLQDNFDFNFTERRLDEKWMGVREALETTYLFNRVHRFGEEMRSESRRVKTAFSDLIATIGAAFDERRVRELDVLQRAGMWIGSGIAVVGLAALFPSLLGLDDTLRHDVVGWLDPIGGARTIGVAVLGMIGAALVLMGTFTARWFLRVGRLGSRHFRPVYDGRRRERLRGRRVPGRSGVWGFLQDASTANLERLAELGQITDAYDQRLAGDFAVLWDRSMKLSAWQRSESVDQDIIGLTRLVEQWGLHGLLLTERARRLHRYPLPVLTCLYRCGSRIRGSFLDLPYLLRTRVVAYVDFARSMERVGFSWDEAELIDKWLRDKEYPTASDALRRVTRLGLAATMDFARRGAAMRVVRDELASIAPVPEQLPRAPETDRDPQLTPGA